MRVLNTAGLLDEMVKHVTKSSQSSETRTIRKRDWIKDVVIACRGHEAALCHAFGIPADDALNKRKFVFPGATSAKAKINDPDRGNGQCDETGKKWGDWVAFAKEIRNDTGMSAPAEFVASVIGHQIPTESRPAKKDASEGERGESDGMPKSLELLNWNPNLAATYLRSIGISIDRHKELEAAGIRIAKYSFRRKSFNVLAIPVWGDIGSHASPNNWIVIRCDGGKLPSNEGPIGKKTIGGKGRGIIGDIRQIDRLIAGERPSGPAIKCEGVTDWIGAFLRDDKPDGVMIWTNPHGARDVRLSWEQAKWAFDIFSGMDVWVCHDADEAGQKGAIGEDLDVSKKSIGWCQRLAEAGANPRNVPLPYPMVAKKGKDLRDFFADGNSFADLVAIADKADVVESPKNAVDDLDDLMPFESPDDPARLARLNVSRYEERRGGSLVYWNGTWWRYESGCYARTSADEMDSQARMGIDEELDNIAEAENDGESSAKKKSIANSLVANVLSAMKSLCLVTGNVEMPCWLGEPKKSTNCISTLNGILDVDAIIADDDHAGWLTDHSSSWFSPVQLDYEFDAGAECPRWDKYLKSSLPDPKSQALVQEFAGYTLVARNPFQKFLAVEGEGGTGKSVYAAGVTAMLGDASVSNAELREFGSRFGLSDTIGKALNVDGDVQRDAKFSEGSFKKFCIGERMSFEFKGGKPFSHRPTAKVMLLWNERPKIKDTSNGLWRRMLLVAFEHVVTDGEKVLRMDEPSWWADTGELPGMLNWAIEGLRRLYEQNHFTEPDSMKSLIREYKTDSNPVEAFLTDCVVVEKDVMASTSSLVEAFREWCIDFASPQDAESMTNKKMGWAIRKKFPAAGKFEKRDAAVGHFRGYEGIRIRTPGEDDSESQPKQENLNGF